MSEERKIVFKTISIDLRTHRDITKIIREAMKTFKTDKKSKAVIFALQEWYVMRRRYLMLIKEVEDLKRAVEKLIREVEDLKMLYLRSQKNK